MATGSHHQLTFKLSEFSPSLLRNVLQEMGWKSYDETCGLDNWNLYWKGARFTRQEYKSCKVYQKMNHFPNTMVITRKEELLRMMKTLKVIYGSIYNFIPFSFCVPTEYKKFLRYYQDEMDLNRRSCWIAKPADLSRGRGIYLFRDIHKLYYDCNTIVQKYIENPLLIAGYKFDLRCYVLVRSYNPLVIYLYSDGLTRFATLPFDLGQIENSFIHLTNTSINKLSPTLNTDKKDVGAGCKWDFKRLKAHLESQDIDFSKLWDKMKSHILLSLLPIANDIPKTESGCFELYGFDFLVDEKLKVWLLEINLSPALSVDCQVDISVKKPLIRDIILLLDCKQTDCEINTTNSKQKQKEKDKIWVPFKCGQFTKIYPHPDLVNSDTLHLKVGSPSMKQMLLEIKNLSK